MKCESDPFSSEDELTNLESSPINDAQITTRKKNRRIIEKRRRDRINRCLAELKRLVPTAYEKQGSAKLEKAEILQMTVDHLLYLKNNMREERDGTTHYYGRLPLAAVDYKACGFYGCALELNRYLLNNTGMDINNPSRTRLLNHLESNMNQRFANCSCSRETLPSIGPVAFHTMPQQAIVTCQTATLPIQVGLTTSNNMKTTHVGAISIMDNPNLCSRVSINPSIITDINPYSNIPVYSRSGPTTMLAS